MKSWQENNRNYYLGQVGHRCAGGAILICFTKVIIFSIHLKDKLSQVLLLEAGPFAKNTLMDKYDNKSDKSKVGKMEIWSQWDFEDEYQRPVLPLLSLLSLTDVLGDHVKVVNKLISRPRIPMSTFRWSRLILQGRKITNIRQLVLDQPSSGNYNLERQDNTDNLNTFSTWEENKLQEAQQIK